MGVVVFSGACTFFTVISVCFVMMSVVISRKKFTGSESVSSANVHKQHM